MRHFLENKGYDVIIAKDGYQAVERAVSEHPDLIIMDIAMPVMDGIQATQEIRKHDDLQSVPILALTAYADFYSNAAAMSDAMMSYRSRSILQSLSRS